MKNIKEPIPFRITIGVTGHRKITKSEKLCQSLNNIFEKIMDTHSDSGQRKVKLCVLTSLAEGSDRIVAEAALDFDSDTVIKTILPLSIDDYCNDFSNNESKKQFFTLMESSRFPLTLRESAIDREYPENLRHEARLKAYEMAGRYVVDHSDVMIAIYDGLPPRGKGGTGEIVQYAKEIKRTIYLISSKSQDQFSLKKGDESITNYLKNGIDNFNRSFQKYFEKKEYHVLSETFKGDAFLPSNNILRKKGIVIRAIEMFKETIDPYFIHSDRQAIFFQRLFRQTASAIFIFAFLALFVTAFGIVFFHAKTFFFIIEFFLLSFIGFIFYFSEKVMNCHRRWIEYRYLAERLRMSYFLYLIGIEPFPVHLSRLSGDQKEINGGWAILVFEEIWNQISKKGKIESIKPSSLGNIIIDCWIQDQILFHKKNAKKNHNKSEMVEFYGKLIYVFALLSAFLHIVFPSIITNFHNLILHNFLIMGALTLPTMAATIEAIKNHRDYKRLHVRANKMVKNLSTLKEKYSPLSSQRIERLVREAEAMMMEENKEWLTALSLTKIYPAV